MVIADLRLADLFIVYAGENRFRLAERVAVFLSLRYGNFYPP